MKVSISHDFKFQGTLSDPSVLWARISQYQIAAIRKRTQQESVDADGKPFKPYSKQYLRRRQKKSLSSKVNLTVTGRMMQTLRVIKRTKKVMEIGWTGAGGRRASYHIDAKNPKMKRDFMGFTDEDEHMIDQIVDQWVEEELRRRL